MPHHQLPLGRRAPGQVHAVQHHARFDECFDDPHRLVRNRVLRLPGRGADVMRAVKIGQFQNRIVERGHAFGRFGIEHIQAGADAFGFHRLAQRRLVHHFAAGSIDEDGARLHQPEPGAIDQFARFRVQRHMQRHDVRLPENVIHAFALLHAQFPGQFGRQRTRPCNDAQTKGVRPADDFASNAADADHSQRLAEKPVGRENSFLFHWPARRAATFSGMRRSMDSSRANTNSATAMEFLPGQLLTNMPRLLAALTSMVLTPAPARSTSARWCEA
jgi:hypothetical protein